MMNNLDIKESKIHENNRGPPLISRISKSLGPENMQQDHHSGRVSRSGDVKKMIGGLNE
jgi:hypothetical protein